MRVTIYQPQYFPRLHYINRILNADTFVLLESAQYTKSLVHFDNGHRQRHKSFQSDAVIKTSQGLSWLTVPVSKGIHSLHTTQLNPDARWINSHLGVIRSAYAKAPRYKQLYPTIEVLLKQPYASLASLNQATILWSLSVLLQLDIPIPELSIHTINNSLHLSSLFRLKQIIGDEQTGVVRPQGLQQGTAWTVAICKALDATEYFHGGTAQAGYMDESKYTSQGISLITQEWKCQEYSQLFIEKHGFLSNLSILDLLFNVNPQTAIQILS